MIIIKKENYEKINELLETVQHRCTVRTVTLQDILDEIAKVDEIFDRYKFTENEKNNTKYRWNAHLKIFASAYQYFPEGTNVKFEYKNRSWRIIEVYRDDCDASVTANRSLIQFSDAGKAKIAHTVSLERYYNKDDKKMH